MRSACTSTGCPEPSDSTRTALDLYARSGRNLFEQAVVESGDIGHDLNVVNDRTVVDGDEGHVLISPFGPYPSFDDHVRSRRRRSEQLRDFVLLSGIFRLLVVCASSVSCIVIMRLAFVTAPKAVLNANIVNLIQKSSSRVPKMAADGRSGRVSVFFYLPAVRQRKRPNPVGSGAWMKLDEKRRISCCRRIRPNIPR